MLPSQVRVRQGDRVKWVTKTRSDIHTVTFPKVWNDIKPYWLGDAGCDLTKSDPMTQYTPSNPPNDYRPFFNVKWTMLAESYRVPAVAVGAR